MSDTTHQAVADAIAAHFADEVPGVLLTGWIMQAAGVTADDMANTQYIRVGGDQALHEVLGLLAVCDAGVRRDWAEEEANND